MFRKLATPVAVVIVVFILAGLPQLLAVDGEHLVFRWLTPLNSAVEYGRGLFSGQSFSYFAGRAPHNFLRDIPIYLLTSALYLTISAFFGLNLGIILGMFSSRLRSGFIKDCFGLLSTIPDFIIILFLQRGAVSLYELTGTRVVRVASLTLNEPAILLPLLTMSLIPAFYLIRTVSVHTDQILGQDYIQCARAKGLSPYYIYLHHVFSNIIPFIKADIHKISALMLANLFVAEYLFNIFGITRLLFKYGFQFFRYSYVINYQYNLVVNSLIAVIILYAGFNLLLRAYVRFLEWRLCR